MCYPSKIMDNSFSSQFQNIIANTRKEKDKIEKIEKVRENSN
jgi:S-adenosylhomocysteine hydrolase